MIKKHFFVLILILFASFLLNLYGIKWGLPSNRRAILYYSDSSELQGAAENISEIMKKDKWQTSEFIIDKEVSAHTSYFDILRSYNCDEEYIIKRLRCMNPSKLDFNPRVFIYPTFFIYMFGIIIKIISIFGLVVLKSDINFYLFHPEEFAKIYITGRLTAGVMGVFVVYLTYLLGKKIYNEKVGLISALFIMLFPLFVVNAHYLKLDVPVTLWFLLSILFSLYILESDNIKLYILAGIFAGLSAGTKYPGGLVVLTIPFAHFLRTKEKFFRLLVNKKVITGIIFSLLSFFLVSPYCVIDYKSFIRDFQGERGLINFSLLFKNTLYYTETIFKYAMGPVSFLISFTILSYIMFREKRKEEKLLLFIIIVFSLFIFVGTSYQKPVYLMPIFPLIFILNAKILGQNKKINYVIIAITIICSLYYTITYDYLFAHNDTRMESAKWIEQNIKKGAEIGMIQNPVIYRMPPVNPTKYKIIATGDNLSSFKKHRPRYFIITNSWSEFADNLIAEGYREIKSFRALESIFGFKINKNVVLPACLEYLCFRAWILEKT